MGPGMDMYDASYYPPQPYGGLQCQNTRFSASPNFGGGAASALMNGVGGGMGPHGGERSMMGDCLPPMPCRTSVVAYMNRNQMAPYPNGHQQQQYMRSKRAQCPIGNQVCATNLLYLEYTCTVYI